MHAGRLLLLVLPSRMRTRRGRDGQEKGAVSADNRGDPGIAIRRAWPITTCASRRPVADKGCADRGCRSSTSQRSPIPLPPTWACHQRFGEATRRLPRLQERLELLLTTPVWRGGKRKDATGEGRGGGLPIRPSRMCLASSSSRGLATNCVWERMHPLTLHPLAKSEPLQQRLHPP